MWILKKSLAFNNFRFLKLSYSSLTKKNNYQRFIKQLSPCEFVLTPQNSHWIKSTIDQTLFVILGQSSPYRNKTSSRVPFRPSLISGEIFLMHNASKNSNWDKLHQVSRTQKLERTELTKCCLLLISFLLMSEYWSIWVGL